MSRVDTLRRAVPHGTGLRPDEWRRRHRVVCWVLWLHVPALLVFGLIMGTPVPHAVTELGPVTALALLASSTRLHRRSLVFCAAAGLVVSSAMVVHVSGGVIEAHFHFFVVIGLVSLYYDWVPFLVAIAFTALHHGVLGTLYPMDVFNHHAAREQPWRWAAIHAGFVLAASAANLLAWRMNEEDHRHAEDAIKSLSQQNALILRSAGEGIFGLDAGGRFTFVNPAAATTLGWRAEDLTGRPMHALVHHSRSNGHPYRFENSPFFATLSDGKARSASDEIFWRVDGTPVPVDYTTATIEQDGRIQGLVVTFRDVTDRKDSLTGLDGRSWFFKRADEALKRRSSGSDHAAVLFVDVDRFKFVNDTLGHPAGDAVLIGVARRLQAAVRPRDAVARLGGDEFVVLCEHIADQGAAEAIASAIVRAFESPFNLGDKDVSISVSVGIALAGEQDAVGALISDADAAMYRAKRLGGECHRTFNADMRSEHAERLWMDAGLRHAVEAGELHLVYQPLVDTRDDEIFAAEALLRWDHPERGAIPPDKFIPVAEATGLIVSIGEWVLREACREAARWRDEWDGRSPSISVNLSPLQLLHPGLVETVASVLAETALEPALLCLELTESALVAPEAAAVLDSLTVLGVRLAIDDFGTGYSSLSYLKRLPVSVLKIDRTFVDALGGPEGAAIVAATIKLAHALQLGVVAEGVETIDQLHHLQKLGCQAAQGFYFAKPLPPMEFRALVREGSCRISGDRGVAAFA